MSQGYFICQSCGKRVKPNTDKPPCEVLEGWLMVSRWKGPRAVEHHNFCSLTCLKTWSDTQVPQVPDVYLRAFDEGND